MLQRLVDEMGFEPERAAILTSSPDASPAAFMERIRDAVGRICAFGPSPIRAEG